MRERTASSSSTTRIVSWPRGISVLPYCEGRAGLAERSRRGRYRITVVAYYSDGVVRQKKLTYRNCGATARASLAGSAR